MDNTCKKIGIAVLEFFILSLLAVAVPCLLYIDIRLLEHGVPESSLTEITQEALVLITSLVFVYHAWKDKSRRGFMILIAGFFMTVLIRELDVVFDVFSHGFWIWPALAVVGISLILTFINRDTVLRPMGDFINTRSYYFILIGLVIVLVFSRTFGSGNQLWEYVMGDDYKRLYKTAVQEGLELLGYIVIFYGVCLFPRLARNCGREEKAGT